MKMKKIALALETALACTSLAACGNPDNKLIFNDYWELNSLAPSSSLQETLVYKVKFEADGGLNMLNYKLSYGEGTYTTTLKSQGQGYVYTTSLSMPVSFKYGSDAAVEATDTVETEVTFQRAGNGLTPISSKKKVVSHTPTQNTATSSDSCFLLYDFTVETLYAEDGKATSAATYSQAEGDPIVMNSEFSYDGGKHSYLDNEQLLLALRAVSASTTSGTVKSYNVFTEAKQSVKLSFSTEETGKEFSYTLNGQDIKTNISYRSVNMVIDAKNPGATQTALIATTSKPENNVHRNVMLQLVTPLSYSIGRFVYTLSSITRN